MDRRVHDRLIEAAPELANPSKRLGQLLDDAEAVIEETEDVLAVGAGRVGVTGVVGIIVLTDRRLVGVSAGGQPRLVPVADVTSAYVNGHDVTVTTPTSDFKFSTDQAGPIVDALRANSVPISAPVHHVPTERSRTSEPLSFILPSCVVLGGSGPWDLRIGDAVDVHFGHGKLWISAPLTSPGTPPIAYENLRSFELSGRGEVTAGGGFIGGGFGVKAAIEGIAVARVLNALTTRSTVETVIRIDYSIGEVFLAHTTWPPAQLRVTLSEVYVRIHQPPNADPEVGARTGP